ncbi:hypothetical protein M3Y97_00963500 [Aphelenchoides bicaudatus]|nr:hypothetical protein M3Y97_00963500 [Aphelenchoides bicaudatus]
MVYDDMKKEGCAVMFNDDPGTMADFSTISHLMDFESRQPIIILDPTTLTSTETSFEEAQLACVNGEFLIPKWVNTFSTMYKEKCHFSFNHFSFFTHANGNNLELYDMHVSDALQRMKQAGVFDNTVLIVMGDHGQRIVSFVYFLNARHRMKYGYYGKMEERMPLAAIHLPEKFKRTHPKLYRRFITNTNRFTSTFDLHETLKLLTQLRYHNETATNPPKNPKIPKIPKKEKVGRTLFEEIPKDRNCVDAKVPLNFCVCMEELDNDMNITDPEIAIMLKDYLRQKLDSAPCLKKWKVVYESPMIVYAVNSLVRYGPRYLDEWERRITIYGKSAHIFREIVEIEKNLTLSLKFSSSTPNEPLYEDSIDLMFRFQYQRNETMRPIEELPWGATTYKNSSLVLTTDPWIYNAPCSALNLDQLCSKCNLPSTINVLNSSLPPINFTAPNVEDNLTTSNVQESLKT